MIQAGVWIDGTFLRLPTLYIMDMKNISMHKIISILVATAVSVTSIGFATVVGYCSMSKSSVCCCESERSAENALPSKAQTIGRPSFSCYSERIVGEQGEFCGFVPEDVTFKTSIVVLEATSPDFPNTLATGSTSLLLPFDSGDETPLKSDIYLHIRSLLI